MLKCLLSVSDVPSRKWPYTGVGGVYQSCTSANNVQIMTVTNAKKNAGIIKIGEGTKKKLQT